MELIDKACEAVRQAAYYKATLERIADMHLGDQPAAVEFESYARQHIATMRKVAHCALEAEWAPASVET